MTLDFNENLDGLILEITAFQTIDKVKAKYTKISLSKEDIDNLEHIGLYLPGIVLEELIRELYECNTDKDYNEALTNFDDKELNELLLRLDVKFKNLWNDEK